MQFWQCTFYRNLLCTLFTYTMHPGDTWSLEFFSSIMSCPLQKAAVTTHNFNLIFCHFYIILIPFIRMKLSMHRCIFWPPTTRQFSLFRGANQCSWSIFYTIFFRNRKKNTQATRKRSTKKARSTHASSACFLKWYSLYFD